MSLQDKLDNYLFKYRNKPTTTTNFTPAEIMFRYKPRTIIDLFKTKVNSKNESDTKIKDINLKNENKKNIIMYNVNDKVWYQNELKNNIKQLPAIIANELSPVRYLIKIENRVRQAHDENYSSFSSDEENNEKSVELRRSSRVKKRTSFYHEKNYK